MQLHLIYCAEFEELRFWRFPCRQTKEIAMRSLTLVSHQLCPYVQRAAISLAEKGVPFERRDVDLANKPHWFCRISPLGKVPLLQVAIDEREETIFESTVILEYIEVILPTHYWNYR